jgi:hypothetical protein
LSYVGEPFEYDVFVSYAQATTETDAPLIRDWSRHVAGRLRELLATALNVDGTADQKVQVFLDDRVLVAGQPLTETLRDKVKRSALLLVLLSPLYPKKDWCLKELDWFFEQAREDGRGHEHCTVLRIQPLANEAWPRLLQDKDGKPVLALDFVDPASELPVGLMDLQERRLAALVTDAFIQVKGKLVALRKLIEARRQMTASLTQQRTDRPVIYLDASPEEAALWEKRKGDLRGIAIVRPTTLSSIGDELDPFDHERHKRRRQVFESSHALVFLDGGREGWLEHAVETSYLDRQLLWQRQRHLPWAILHRPGGKPAVADDYDVPCVPADSENWQRALLVALGLATGAGGAAS